MFFDFSIKDVIDILLFALLLYYLYRLMKDSGSLNIFVGIMIFLFVWVLVSKILGMRLLGSVFDQMMNVGAIVSGRAAISSTSPRCSRVRARMVTLRT